MNKSFENLTIVSITGNSQYVQGAIYAIARSCNELKGAKGLLICPPLPDGIVLPANIEHKQIDPMGYTEYNIFVLYQLEFYIETDYCLIVQNDGWVTNGKNWREEFWDYDYIGAPIPRYAVYDGLSVKLLPSAHYLENLDLINEPSTVEPQNGGFCFRSKKLLGMPRKLDLPYHIQPPPPPAEGETFHKLGLTNKIHFEDMFLSVLYRHLLIENGIRFAPSEVGYAFAVESVDLHILRNYPLDNVVGCHFFGYAKLIGENLVEVHILGEHAFLPIESLYKSDPRLNLLKKLGYQLHFVLHR